jgi:membrane peptidoglycan carboxypeptidase
VPASSPSLVPDPDELFVVRADETRLNATAVLSFFSDWLSWPLVEVAARRYSRFLHTPQHFVEMLLLVEDKRFPAHFGVDPVAILRAPIFDLQGKAVQGASTIGQQVYTIRRSRSDKLFSHNLAYKAKQVVWSLCRSMTTSKASILKEYVDCVYWGRSYHGLDSAVAGYFGGTRDSLSIAQSFFLAERIAAPNRVSTQRIFNLLSRPPIRENLRRNGAMVGDVVTTYDKIYNCGGQMWQLLAK